MHILQRRARILTFKQAETLRNARLDDLVEKKKGDQHELLMDYHELRLNGEPALVLDQGRPAEHVLGEWVPRRLRFSGISMLNLKGLYARLDKVAPEHAVRSLRGALYWRPPGQPAGQGPLFLLIHGSDEPATLILSATRLAAEKRSGATLAADFLRDWSSPPLLSPGLVPAPLKLRERRGGDPVTVHVDGRTLTRSLFVGGIEEQPEQRPQVDFVLNLGEDPSRWTDASVPLHPADRWARKGEGSCGMSTMDIRTEAEWVIHRLRAGLCGLVHCSAGFNRSVTVCCAVLILLEGLSADAALARVREHHPWARPDSQHWLALRWLASGN